MTYMYESVFKFNFYIYYIFIDFFNFYIFSCIFLFNNIYLSIKHTYF